VARSLLGQFLGIAGLTEDGLRELDTAIRLSPRDPQLWSFHAGRSIVFFVAGRYEESRAASERVLEYEPGTAIALSNIAATSALLGELPRAREALDDTLRVWPDMSIETLRTLNASVPAGPVEEFFRGLRLAGWDPGAEAGTQSRDPVTTPHES
jgi:tetratricopeptide (TPR) repeat protein